MGNTYHQVFLQTIFAVKYRDAVIDKLWRHKLLAVIGNLINDARCKTIIVNGVEDHVHCLFELRPVISISELMKAVKAKSSKYVNDSRLTEGRFEWQQGYGVFSYGYSQIPSIRKYIENQEKHHETENFKDEYVRFLKNNNINFDDAYIFNEPV